VTVPDFPITPPRRGLGAEQIVRLFRFPFNTGFFFPRYYVWESEIALLGQCYTSIPLHPWSENFPWSLSSTLTTFHPGTLLAYLTSRKVFWRRIETNFSLSPPNRITSNPFVLCFLPSSFGGTYLPRPRFNGADLCLAEATPFL